MRLDLSHQPGAVEPRPLSALLSHQQVCQTSSQWNTTNACQPGFNEHLSRRATSLESGRVLALCTPAYDGWVREEQEEGDAGGLKEEVLDSGFRIRVYTSLDGPRTNSYAEASPSLCKAGKLLEHTASL